MSIKGLALGFALIGAAVASFATPGSAQTPGTVPPGYTAPAPAPRPSYAPEPSTGLKVFYRKFGKVTLSVDAGGKVSGDYKVDAKKPSKTAKVAKAFLMATTNNSGLLPNNSVKIDGKGVTWMAMQASDIPSGAGFFRTGLADVTDLVKEKINKADAGNVSFNITELELKTDGTTLVVVFKTPEDKRSKTIALLFGGLKTMGDTFSISLDDPIDPKGKNALANMGLGISYSYQFNGIQQYTIIDVNGFQRMTTAAGGEDDGEAANGALITAGGIGDKDTNPDNPTGFPINARSDDERYSLLPFMKKDDTLITVKTINPSNDDNVFFAYFELSAEGDVDKDTDGDGLLDVWEKDGLDFDADGKIDVKLPGANFKKKDIYIAYAWMNKGGSDKSSHEPSQAVLNAVSEAFARAPVSNPDGTKGIKIHWKKLKGVPHDDDLNPVWTEFDAIMNPLVSEAERVVYHRMLNAHAYGGGSSSGLSRDIPASDFIESLGKFSTNPGTFSQRAGTIMHELGHNLGLRHGGVDHENYKPNHFSVMSYLNQMDWVLKDGKPFLDYERFKLGKLEENKLNEKNGVKSNSGSIANYGVRWMTNNVLYEKKRNANKDVDWNKSGSFQGKVSVDINNSGSLSTLRADFAEWSNIIYNGGSIGSTGATAASRRSLVTDPSDLKEFDVEDYERLLKRRVVE